MLSNLGSPAVHAATDQKIQLRANGQNLLRVRIEMDVKGNVDIPKNPLVSQESDRKLPITGTAVLDYEERYRRPADADENSVVTLVERFYHEAKSSRELNRQHEETKLRESVRNTIVRRELLPEVVYGVDDYFQRNELDLLRVPVSSVAIDELLPNDPVQQGSQYYIANEAVTSVLNLTSVLANDIVARVTEITDKKVKIEFKGKVDGAVEGVPTVVKTVGKLLFDRQIGTCTWLAIAVHETREIGKAEPGFDVAATIKMIRQPMAKPVALEPQPPRLNITSPIPQDRLYVDLLSEQLGVSVLMNRDWRMMTDVAGAAMMRMTRDDRSIAQCDFRPLASLKPGEHWTLEAFQEDIKTTLGEQLAEFIQADQAVSDSGLRVLKVTAAGAVEGVPIRWILVHFSDDSGRRVLATFTMEGDHADEFAGADVQLANSLRFTEAKAKTSEVAKKPAKDAAPRIAKANSDESSNLRVQSPSDR